jgi:hypothetical protein
MASSIYSGSTYECRLIRHAYQIYTPMLLLPVSRRFIREPILKSCAGMDVHEKKVDVCIAHGPFDKTPKFEIRTSIGNRSSM